MTQAVWRLGGRSHFTALARGGTRRRSGPITVTWVTGDPSDPPRVAYAIGRRVGGAVVRNRLRRQLRAIIADACPLPGDYLVGVAPMAEHLPFDMLRTHVHEALAAFPPSPTAQPGA